jgi:hypothetical protein
MMNHQSASPSKRHAGVLLDANDFEVVVPSNFVDLGVPKPKKASGVTASAFLTTCDCSSQCVLSEALHIAGYPNKWNPGLVLCCNQKVAFNPDNVWEFAML